MKILAIKASNFKSFDTLEIDEFLRMNFIFGFNNSGKSNLLRLIDTIFSRKIVSESTKYSTPEGGTETRVVTRKSNFWEGIIEKHSYIFRFGDLSKPISFSVLVELDYSEISKLESYKDLVKANLVEQDKSCQVLIKGRIESLGRSDAKQELDNVLLNDNEIFNRQTSSSATVAFEELLGLMNDSVLFIDYDRYLKDEIEDKSVSDLLPNHFRNWLFNLSLSSDLNKEYNEILKAVRGFKIDSRDTKFKQNERSNPFNKGFEHRFARNGERLDMFFKNDFGEIPLSSFGTGVQQLIYIVFKIFDAKPKILLMEELELNLSPKYQDLIIKYFETLVNTGTSISQTFITSHSPLHCYRSQDRSLMAEMGANGETKFEKFILDEKENKKLKQAHDFLIRSVYGIKSKES